MQTRLQTALIGATSAVLLSLAFSSVAFGQSKAFDPHDLSGFWDITNAGLPRGALNATSNNRPQMTPEGLEKFRKTKAGYDAKALGNGDGSYHSMTDPAQVSPPPKTTSST